MRKLAFVMLCCLLGSHPASAEENCKKIEDDVQRLECFDAKFGVSFPEEETLNQGEWEKVVEISKLTDEKSVFLSLKSENDLLGRFQGSGPATLHLRCLENTTSIFIVMNGHFLADIQGYGQVEYRIDNGTMRSRGFSESTDNEALGLWNGGQSIPFIKAFLGGRKLILRLTPYNQSPMTVEFNIAGIDDAIKELRETCSW